MVRPGATISSRICLILDYRARRRSSSRSGPIRRSRRSQQRGGLVPEPPRSRPTARATIPISRSKRPLCRAASRGHAHRAIGRTADHGRARHPPTKSADAPAYRFSGVPYWINASTMLPSSTPSTSALKVPQERGSTRYSLFKQRMGRATTPSGSDRPAIRAPEKLARPRGVEPLTPRPVVCGNAAHARRRIRGAHRISPSFNKTFVDT
jgi:hypothetical protein